MHDTRGTADLGRATKPVSAARGAEPVVQRCAVDPIAHTFTGGALAAAGLRRSTPLATAALLLGANAPDVDVFAYFAGEFEALAFRRGVTHGVLALAVWPFLVTALLLLWDRFAPWRRRPNVDRARAGPLLAVSTLAVATHPTLDWLNNYGLRWLMPFDGRWFYGDALFIVDPWLWLGLGGVLFLMYSRRRLPLVRWGLFWLATSFLVLTNGELLPGPAKIVWLAGIAALFTARAFGFAAPQREGAVERAARIALVIAALYVAALTLAGIPARAGVRAGLAARGIDAGDVMVAPAPANPFAGDVIAATDDFDLRRPLELARGAAVRARRRSHPDAATGRGRQSCGVHARSAQLPRVVAVPVRRGRIERGRRANGELPRRALSQRRTARRSTRAARPRPAPARGGMSRAPLAWTSSSHTAFVHEEERDLVDVDVLDRERSAGSTALITGSNGETTLSSRGYIIALAILSRRVRTYPRRRGHHDPCLPRARRREARRRHGASRHRARVEGPQDGHRHDPHDVDAQIEVKRSKPELVFNLVESFGDDIIGGRWASPACSTCSECPTPAADPASCTCRRTRPSRRSCWLTSRCSYPDFAVVRAGRRLRDRRQPAHAAVRQAAADGRLDRHRCDARWCAIRRS